MQLMTIKKILIYLAVCLQCCRAVARGRHMRTTNIWIESMLFSNLFQFMICESLQSEVEQLLFCFFDIFFLLFGFYEFTVARGKVTEKSACRTVAGLFQLVSLAIQKEKQHKKRNQFAFTPDTMCCGRRAVPFAHFFFHVQKSFRSNFSINQNVPQRRAYDTVVCLLSTECADPSVLGAAIRSLRSPVDATT